MKRILLFLLSSIILISCTSEFEEINTNPNAPVNVDASYLMSSVIINTAYNFTEENIKSAMGVPTRYITRVVHNADDTFRWDAEGWSYAYDILINNEDLLHKARENGNSHLEAVALIVKGYVFGTLTDLYGDIPFENAFEANNENFTPAYSNQENIYDTVIDYFELANTLLAEEGNLDIYSDNDPMYSGNAAAWQRLANSLKLRYLLRISNKRSDAFQSMQEMVSNPNMYPLISSNTYNAKVPYLGLNDATSSPLSAYDGDFYDRRPSKVLVDFLKERNDPRLASWIRPVAEPSRGTVSQDAYVGLPIAIFGAMNYNGTTNHTNYETSNYSEFSEVFHENSNDLFHAVWMNAAEVQFILAEAVQQGHITVPGATAESLYRSGIRLSMEQYNLEDALETSGYFENELVAYDGSQQQILEQKWISLLFVAGAESWFDHRRTGFPDFPFGPQSIREEIPFRLPYPSDEMTYNSENYNAAIRNQGWESDDNYQLMWLLN